MAVISFTVLTDTPKALYDRLVEYGLVDGVTNSATGVEIVEVPNPIVDDTRHCFLVKVAHEAEAAEVEGKEQVDQDGKQLDRWSRTKLGEYVKTPTVDSVALRDGGTGLGLGYVQAEQIDGMTAHKVGVDFWMIEDTDGRMGVWQ